MFCLHTPAHEFTVQAQDSCREGCDPGAACSELETEPRGEAPVPSPPPPSSENVPPPAATLTTPAAEPAQGDAGAVGTGADEVFSAADEVLSAPDSPQKEFHCAVLRALSKEAELAPGTSDEGEPPKFWPSASSSPAQPRPISLHSAGGQWDTNPASCVLSSFSGF